jgi:hypothetical protein
MTDEELIKRLRERAAEERDVQRNNEAVAAALMGQRLLFDQGIRSKANSFAVRLGLEHESCAKNDAKLAHDWDAAADRIEALVKERDEALNQLDSVRHSVDVLEGRVAMFMARLAKVVAVARAYRIATKHLRPCPETSAGLDAVLAEIEGGKDE